jgi:amino acid transporter
MLFAASEEVSGLVSSCKLSPFSVCSVACSVRARRRDDGSSNSDHFFVPIVFSGSGQALRQGGPLGVLLAWSIVGVLLINVTQALGELCIMFPVSGGFYTLAVRFLDPGFGMAMGW